MSSIGGQHSVSSHSSSHLMVSSSHSSHLVSNQSSNPKMFKSEAIDDFDYPFCDDVSKYEKLTKIGQGLYNCPTIVCHSH